MTSSRAASLNALRRRKRDREDDQINVNKRELYAANRRAKYAENRDQINANRREYRAENRDHINANQREYHA